MACRRAVGETYVYVVKGGGGLSFLAWDNEIDDMNF